MKHGKHLVASYPVLHHERSPQRRHDLREVFNALCWLDAAFIHYNEVHPHRALKMLSPRLFRQQQFS